MELEIIYLVLMCELCLFKKLLQSGLGHAQPMRPRKPLLLLRGPESLSFLIPTFCFSFQYFQTLLFVWNVRPPCPCVQPAVPLITPMTCTSHEKAGARRLGRQRGRNPWGPVRRDSHPGWVLRPRATCCPEDWRLSRCVRTQPQPWVG